jgi:hypothetical protein
VTDELPLSELYTVRSDGYSRGTRVSGYRKRHQLARRAARLNPEGPSYDKAFHERQKAAMRGWAARRRAAQPQAPRPEISLRGRPSSWT